MTASLVEDAVFHKQTTSASDWKQCYPPVLSACPQECMFDKKISTCSSKQRESCTSELDAERRRTPALYPFLSKERRGTTGWKAEMQHVDRAVRRSCLADVCDELTVPARHSWMCSLPAGWGEEVTALLTDWRVWISLFAAGVFQAG